MTTTPADDETPPPSPAPTRLPELQLVELGILLDVQVACDELGIEFFLGEATLLGTVRHRGFIP